jgi:hypothetical protein
MHNHPFAWTWSIFFNIKSNLGWWMYDRVPTRKHETLDESSWSLEAWIGRPHHWFVLWGWMDQVFGSSISLKAKFFWRVVVETTFALRAWNLVDPCDGHQHFPCIIFVPSQVGYKLCLNVCQPHGSILSYRIHDVVHT